MLENFMLLLDVGISREFIFNTISFLSRDLLLT